MRAPNGLELFVAMCPREGCGAHGVEVWATREKCMVHGWHYHITVAEKCLECRGVVSEKEMEKISEITVAAFEQEVS